jgi:WD40 domain-containing protein
MNLRKNGTIFLVLKGHRHAVRRVAVTRDGRAVSASSDKTLRGWDVESGRELYILGKHSSFVNDVAVNRGQLCFLGSNAQGVGHEKEDGNRQTERPRWLGLRRSGQQRWATCGFSFLRQDAKGMGFESRSGTRDVHLRQRGLLLYIYKEPVARPIAVLVLPAFERAVLRRLMRCRALDG